MTELKERKCVPSESDDVVLEADQIQLFRNQLDQSWIVYGNKKLRKEFPFKNFKRGMAFVQEVARIAEKENHHPDVCIHYSNVEVELTTHEIDGLSENDFIMAAKIDEL